MELPLSTKALLELGVATPASSESESAAASATAPTTVTAVGRKSPNAGIHGAETCWHWRPMDRSLTLIELHSCNAGACESVRTSKLTLVVPGAQAAL